MSNTAVHKGDRLQVTFTVAHKAGDLVYEKGFYGTVEDDVAAGALGYIILGEIHIFRRMPATTAMGTKVYAPATAQATTLPLIAAASTGHNAVGRTAATANASGIGWVQLFNPNNY